jgi:type I restriction enzyme S subunit
MGKRQSRAPEAIPVTLPEGWAHSALREITTPVPHANPEDQPLRKFRYVDISSISNQTYQIVECKTFKGADAPSRARRPIRAGDVVFSNVRTYLRNIAPVTTDIQADLCSTGFTVLRPNEGIDSRFLLYAVLTDAFIETVSEFQTGTHYPAVSDRAVLAQKIPLPPLAEQRRIVAKIEVALARVNTARERLAKLPALLKRFRQSVLAAACSGRLTAEWREKNHISDGLDKVIEELQKRRTALAASVAEKRRVRLVYLTVEQNDSDQLPDTWRFVTLNKLCSSFDYGTSAKSHASGSVAVLRMGNVQNREIDWKELVFTSDADEIRRYSLKPHTVLFNRTNSPELVGKTAIYRGERPAIFAGYLIRIVNLPELVPEYLNMCLNTSYARDFCSRAKTDGVSQSNINAKKLGSFEVPFCCLAEQREIVQRVEALFKLAEAIEKRVAMATARAEKLTQSILAKAFRGELVPTEAQLAPQEGRNYESASTLLDRISKHRHESVAPNGARSKRRAATLGTQNNL